MTAANRQLCDEVRERIHEFEGRTRKEIVEIGTMLIRVKTALGHGMFKKWLDAEVQGTIRTAENYMNVAKNIGDKYETVSHLPLTVVYKLAGPAVPDQVRQKIFATIIDPANPPSDEIKKLLGAVREQAKAAAIQGEVDSVKARGTAGLKDNLETPKAEVLSIDGRIVKEHLVLLAKSWLIRIRELAPEICAKIKEYGAYDVGVAIGAAAEAIIATKQTPKNPAPKPEPVMPKPTTPEEITLPTSEYADMNSPAVADYEIEELDLKAA